MTEHTPTPWYAEDWTDDNGSEFVTIAAHEPEVLAPGQSSIWPDGVRKICIAETVDSPNPIADAAFIIKCVNAYPDLVKVLERVQFAAKAPEENAEWMLRELARQAGEVLAVVGGSGT
jgi:hypothetical protein